MSEQDYIDATNLAKLRIAKHCIFDCLDMRDHEKMWRSELLRLLHRWINELEKRQFIKADTVTTNIGGCGGTGDISTKTYPEGGDEEELQRKYCTGGSGGLGYPRGIYRYRFP